MDFFDHQDRARRKTGHLVFLFAVGIGATLLAVNLICFVGYWIFYQPTEITHTFSQGQLPSIFESLVGGQSLQFTEHRSGFLQAWQAWWGSNLNWQISVGVLAAVVIGTVFRFIELAGGGRKVAQWAGAKPVDMISKDTRVKQFINVCEEMAIAAGMPVPELYIMEREDGINAFVAGYTPAESVLVITRGALDALNRDQLQGVVGHEYSHILNGDMRLNVRLMAFLAGLVMIGQIGMFLMESSFGRSHRYRSRNDDSRIGVATFAIGAVMVVVGYIGVLVGRMIKAAVSRQREFLADASSVQFTRNPDGLAGALYEINERAGGSKLHHRHAEDMSHFCFGESVALSKRLATHPPIIERIRRVSPHFLAKERTRRRQTESAEQSVARTAPQAFQTMLASTGIAAMAGQVSPDHLVYAQGLYQHIPEQLKNWVHQSDGAKSFIYAQIMLGTQEQRQVLLNLLKKEDPGVLPVLKSMWSFCEQIDPQLRLPLLEMAIPTLKRLSEPDRLILVDRFERMVHLDGKVDFVEWVTLSLVKLRLANQAQSQINPAKLSGRILDFEPQLHSLFLALVCLSPNRSVGEQSYQKVCQQLGMAPKAIQPVGFGELEAALLALDGISFLCRRTILQSCADIIQSDGRVDFNEYETLRVIAECLSSPLPVLMMALEPRDFRDDPIPFE